MTRVRLRPAHSDDVLAQMYAAPHQHGRWADHRIRVEQTIGLGRELIALTGPPATIIDLSCGDAAIVRGLVPSVPACQVILGDIAPGYQYHGPIEKTILDAGYADLFVLCETLEHLDDPDSVLAAIRYRAASLICSTPLGEFSTRNPQHYWGWDKAGLRDTLTGAGFTPVLYRQAAWTDDGEFCWRYQIWGCT